MRFQIDFNSIKFNDDDFLIKELGAYWVDTKSVKYPPFQVLMIQLDGFRELEALLEKVDTHYGDFYSAVISFDSPAIYLDNKV